MLGSNRTAKVDAKTWPQKHDKSLDEGFIPESSLVNSIRSCEARLELEICVACGRVKIMRFDFGVLFGSMNSLICIHFRLLHVFL